VCACVCACVLCVLCVVFFVVLEFLASCIVCDKVVISTGNDALTVLVCHRGTFVAYVLVASCNLMLY